jgi:hypothetical protein
MAFCFWGPGTFFVITNKSASPCLRKQAMRGLVDRIHADNMVLLLVTFLFSGAAGLYGGYVLGGNGLRCGKGTDERDGVCVPNEKRQG